MQQCIGATPCCKVRGRDQTQPIHTGQTQSRQRALLCLRIFILIPSTLNTYHTAKNSSFSSDFKQYFEMKIMSRYSYLFIAQILKGHGNETDFLGFLQKSVPYESLGSASLIRRVGDSPHHRYGEWAIEFSLKKTLCINDTDSRRLPAPVIRLVAESESR